MKVIRVFKNNISLVLCRDTEYITRNNIQYQEYKKYTDGKVKEIKEMGYFYNKDRKQIKRQYRAKNIMVLSNGNYEKGLYTLKNGLLSIWRLNVNDPKSIAKKLKHGKKSVKHYFKYNNKKFGVI